MGGRTRMGLIVLATFDEGPDLVLHYKHLMVLNGDSDYTLHFNESGALSESQRQHAESQYDLFMKWWAEWPRRNDSATSD